MERKRVLVCSRADPASVAIADYLIGNYDFVHAGTDLQLYTYRDIILMFIGGRHLDYSGLADELKAMSVEPEDVVFLSKHSSSAGIRSLTVHPTGNFGVAQLGGRDFEVSMSDPGFMTSSLRILSSRPVDQFSVTFEATHHGPYTEIPNYFIEIGTTENEWRNTEALSIVTEAIVESRAPGNETFVGVGGGHYSQKITGYALSNDCDIGHIISKHTHNNLTKDMLIGAFRKTPGCKGFIMDSKGSRGNVRQMVKETVNEYSMELIIL